MFDNEPSNCGPDRQAHSEHELLHVADWHDRELRGPSPIGKPPTPQNAVCGWAFSLPAAGSDPLRLSWSPASTRGFFRRTVSAGAARGFCCSVDEMDSGAGGTAQRDVYAVVRHIVRKPNLHVLDCGGAAIEHGGHA